MLVKISNFFLCILTFLPWFFSLWWGNRYIPSQKNFGTISSKLVWIAKLHYFDAGIYFPDNGCHENRKKTNI